MHATAAIHVQTSPSFAIPLSPREERRTETRREGRNTLKLNPFSMTTSTRIAACVAEQRQAIEDARLRENGGQAEAVGRSREPGPDTKVCDGGVSSRPRMIGSGEGGNIF